ncbi:MULTISPECIES: biotin transporter BioY [Spirulina sp. CCY15215]|uniref:biotin transporter BioY n=1 Tax=Spirulina sp. CCY15215 TaxID=2767591 RepID=UPI00194F4945|nr:biotin transporter BioY [Spirulina major]
MSTKNPRRRKRSRPIRRKSANNPNLSLPYKLLWAVVGLFLTIGGTFMEPSTTTLPWNWASESGVQTYALGVTFQVGAVLLVGCLGGKQSGALSQIIYILLGLFLPRFRIFTHGGGLDYIIEPTFGYLLGFIPGAWICGSLAFRTKPTLEALAFSCFCGLFTIHLLGIIYLIGLHLFGFIDEGFIALLQDILQYSLRPLFGQSTIVCGVSVLAFALRRIMFY